MASNPMQRKARNSFLLGMLLMLIISGTIIAFLFLQLKNYKDKEIAEKNARQKVAVLNQDVKSGQIITSDMLTTQEVNKSLIPENAIGEVATLDNYSLQDKEGNNVITRTEEGEPVLYLQRNGKNERLEIESETGNYYIQNGNEKEYIELNTIPVLAKVTMSKNTLLTRETITKGNNTTSDDVRKQEYNVIVLPTQIQTGDYIDVRLSIGELDYIVISKKEVTIPMVGDADSSSTIWLNLTEDEILSMNSAIVDAFKIPGSKLYATTYTEPGIQQSATPTYPISSETYRLMLDNPNIVDQAKQELDRRYNSIQNERPNVNSSIEQNLEEADENLNTKMQESITKTQEERKQYLDGLSGE